MTAKNISSFQEQVVVTGHVVDKNYESEAHTDGKTSHIDSLFPTSRLSVIRSILVQFIMDPTTQETQEGDKNSVLVPIAGYQDTYV